MDQNAERRRGKLLQGDPDLYRKGQGGRWQAHYLTKKGKKGERNLTLCGIKRRGRQKRKDLGRVVIQTRVRRPKSASIGQTGCAKKPSSLASRPEGKGIRQASLKCLDIRSKNVEKGEKEKVIAEEWGRWRRKKEKSHRPRTPATRFQRGQDLGKTT